MSIDDLVAGEGIRLWARDVRSQTEDTAVTDFEGVGVVLIPRLTDAGGRQRPIVGGRLVWHRSDRQGRQIVLPPTSDEDGGDRGIDRDHIVARPITLSPETEGLYWVTLEGRDETVLTSNTVQLLLQSPARAARVAQAARTPRPPAAPWYAWILAPVGISRLLAMLAVLVLVALAWLGRGFYEQRLSADTSSGTGTTPSPVETLPGPSGPTAATGTTGTTGATGTGGTSGTGATTSITPITPTSSITPSSSAATAAGVPVVARTAPPPFTVPE